MNEPENTTTEAPPRPKKPGKREPWRCLYCSDVVLIKDNCRKLDCLEKYEAARERMGLGKAGAR